VSADFEPKEHIDALVRTAIEGPEGCGGGPNQWKSFHYWEPSLNEGQGDNRPVTRENADAVGQMLWMENLRSITHHDAPDRPPRTGLEELVRGYHYTPTPRTLTIVEAFKALHGYEYQTCEHPEWFASEAYRFCDALARRLSRHLPGYADADTWTITRNTYARPRQSHRAQYPR
jgi:hypothetical protein